MAEEGGWAVSEQAVRVPKSPQLITPEQKAESFKKEADSKGAIQYTMSFDNIPPLNRIPSSVMKDGYVEGSVLNVVGVPGSGKSRFFIQECIELNNKGLDCLYLYNESAKPGFDLYFKQICEQLNITDDRKLSHIKWADMSKFTLNSADYDSIKIFMKRVWAKQVEYWLQTVNNPTLVIVDSFSNICRKYVPQMWVSFEAMNDSFKELYQEHKKPIVTAIIHQKSGSHWERDDDSVVGGMGLIHEGDVSMVFKSKHTNNWDAKRYGVNEGMMLRTLMITKDRYSAGEFTETQLLLKDGKLVLGHTLMELVNGVSEQEMNNKDGAVEWH
jgi:predicted ATP-dependent serine protease